MRITIPGSIRISARNPGPLTGSGNWTYLLHGKMPTLIDAGIGAPDHLDEVSSALGNDNLSQTIVTHVHADHAGGTSALAARWPSVRFLKYPWPEQDATYPVLWQPISNGMRLEAGDLSIEVVHTPGHSPDHVCLWHAESRSIFTGDLLIANTTVVIPASRGGSLAAYLESLARIEAMSPRVAFPAHGAIIDDPRALIASYRAHRYEREQQILEAIAGGAATVTAIATTVYADLTPVLRPVNEETVRAHLDKLKDERRIVEGEGRLILT